MLDSVGMTYDALINYIYRKLTRNYSIKTEDGRIYEHCVFFNSIHFFGSIGKFDMIKKNA